MWSLRQPTESQLQAFLEQESAADLTYSDVGASNGNTAPAGFKFDLNRIQLGRGQTTFRQACDLLSRWRHFETTWTRIVPTNTRIEVGRTVVLVIRPLGIWWWNSCRIVYTIDEPKRFGFAYGTLPGHVERGEECFAIEMGEDETVWYTIQSFSRPRILTAQLAQPLARRLQRTFVRDSQTAMVRPLQSSGK